ncbi:hypothetical protein OSTOST_06829 [Ostertagia ostertagi]
MFWLTALCKKRAESREKYVFKKGACTPPGDSALQLYKSLEKGGGEFLSYLDSDLTLADQNDEFSEMKSDRFYGFGLIW